MVNSLARKRRIVLRSTSSSKNTCHVTLTNMSKRLLSLHSRTVLSLQEDKTHLFLL
ncbi:hypothetical protein J6590_010160 [Homalodisca vitripennis]|nr:hypothetical protein J6590_010160 [Homalodisca vitripennis]